MFKKISLNLLLLTTVLFIITSAVSADTRTGRTIDYYGPRKAAMGGTGVALPDKRESLYYNPATIVDAEKGFVINLPFLSGSSEVGVDVVSNLKKLQDANSESDTATALDLFRKVIPSKIGYGYSLNNQWLGDLGTGSIAVGSFANLKLGANLLNRISPRLEAIGYYDLVFPTITYAFPVTGLDKNFFLKNIKLGFTVKNINRYSLFDDATGSEKYTLEVLDMISPDTETKLNVRIGHGTGLDLGLIADVDTFMGPGKFGIAIINLSTSLTGKEFVDMTSSKNTDILGYKEDIPMQGTLGWAVKSSPFEKVALLKNILPDATYAFDFDFLAQDTSIYKRIHLGIEQLYGNGNWGIRLGLNQGYPTLGSFANFGPLHLGLTYYTMEFGREIGENPQSYYILDGLIYF